MWSGRLVFCKFSDILKYLFKEVIFDNVEQGGVLLAPIVTLFLALSAWAVFPLLKVGRIRHQCRHFIHFCDFIAGCLRGDYGRLGVELQISVSGCAALGGTNGVLRGFYWAGYHHGAAMCRLDLTDIVMAQQTVWFAIPLFPMFVIFLFPHWPKPIARRSPEAESELVAGFMTEYSSTPYVVFMIGELANIVLMCAMTTILFLGGWLPPFDVAPFNWVPSVVWFLLKMTFMCFMFSMVKAIVPRYRYDQLCALGGRFSCRYRFSG